MAQKTRNCVCRKPMDINVEIIKGEYPIRINLNNRVYVTEFSLVVPNQDMQAKVEKSFSKVFDTLRVIFSTYSVDQFKKTGIEKK